MPDAHRIDLPQGTLDLLILQALAREPRHGWAISERVQQISNDVLRIQQGSLYPALQLEVERDAWVKLTAAMAQVLGTAKEIPAC